MCEKVQSSSCAWCGVKLSTSAPLFVRREMVHPARASDRAVARTQTDKLHGLVVHTRLVVAAAGPCEFHGGGLSWSAFAELMQPRRTEPTTECCSIVAGPFLWTMLVESGDKHRRHHDNPSHACWPWPDVRGGLRVTYVEK